LRNILADGEKNNTLVIIMFKKIIIIVAAIIILLMIGLVKFWYPDSQMQLRRAFQYVSAMPIEHFYNTTEKRCGIWYERYSGDTLVESAKKNNKIKDCFQKAFQSCEPKNILLVKESSEATEKNIIYTLIRTIKANDAGECIIQTYQDEYFTNPVLQDELPISYINTCTVLNNDFISSCEPLYAKERKTKYLEMETQADSGATENITE